MSGTRPFSERVLGRVVRRPYHDALGRKGWLGPFARAQPHVVRRYKLALPGWPRFARPLRIALLTDLHVGSHTGDVARFGAIAREVAALSPDLVLLGGDYVNMQPLGRGRVPPHIIAGLLAPVTGRHGRFAILGNHDYIYGEREVAQAFQERGIVVLDHGTQTFSYEKHAIDVIGVPDANVERFETQGLLAGLPPDRPTIVLAHDPVWFAEVPPGPYLTLAGHTHGGQVRLPGVGAMVNSSRAPMRWTHGLVVEGGRHLIVSAGLGTSAIPLRVGVPPEYAVIEVSGA